MNVTYKKISAISTEKLAGSRRARRQVRSRAKSRKGHQGEVAVFTSKWKGRFAMEGHTVRHAIVMVPAPFSAPGSPSVRGNGALKEAWSFFGSQPNPTPSSRWRYSIKTGANQSIIDFLPDLIKESDLGSYHYSRDKNFELKEPGAFISQTWINKYLDERQYEMFTVGLLLREEVTQKQLYELYFNHSYSFNLISPQEIAPNLTTESTTPYMSSVYA